MPSMFERLSVTLWTRPGGSMILNATAYVVASASSFKTNPHGYAMATIVLDLSYSRVMYLRSQLANAHLIIHDGATCRWEGRIEDRRVDGDSLVLTAYGYQRALWDIPITEVWSSTSVADWQPVLNTQWSSAAKDKYILDTQNRLFISPKKNQTVSNAVTGALYVGVPAGGSRLWTAISFDWNLTFTGVGWTARALATDDFVSFSTIWTQNSAASALTGSQNLTFTGKRYVVFDLFYNNAIAATTTADDGTAFLRITNLRVKTTTSAAVYADEIARHLVTTINGNGGLSTLTSRIQSPGLDLRDEIYLDANMADILSSFERLGDNQTPPRQWEWGVWEDRALHLRPRGSAGRTWYVTVPDPVVEDTLDTLVNSITPILKDAQGERVVGTTVSDAASIARFDLTRRQHLNMDTTSSTEAATRANARLADGKDPAPSVSIPIDSVRDVNGGSRPLYEPRSGDTIVIQNLPVNLATDVDRIRVLRLSETTYVLDGRATVTPERPLPTLDVLLARRAEGL